MTTNGHEEFEDADELGIFDEIIEKIKLFEGSKMKIIEQETALRQIIRSKNDEERDAIQQCRDLLQLKEELRTELIRLNDQNERMSDQMDTVKALEIEIQSLNAICNDVNLSTSNLASLLCERQARILNLKPQIAGHEIGIGTNIEGPDGADLLMTELNETVQNRLDSLNAEIEKTLSAHEIHPVEDMNNLLNEEKTLKKQIRELKRQLKKDISDTNGGHRGIKRGTPSSHRSRKRHTGSRMSS